MDINVKNSCRLGTGGLKSRLRCGLLINKPSVVADFITDEYALVYIWEGSGVFIEKDGKEHELAPGYCFQRFPGVAHSLKFIEETAIGYIAVPSPFYGILKAVAGDKIKCPVLKAGKIPGLLGDFEKMIDELDTCEENELLKTVAGMQELIIRILMSAGKGAVSPVEIFCEKACRVLEKNIKRRVPLSKTARELNVSYSLFRKNFIAGTGMPPGAYVIHKRMEKAGKMLVDEGMSVSEAASVLGYPDIYSFSRQFKKFYGESPCCFKKNSLY